jgi:hypothetical protein
MLEYQHTADARNHGDLVLVAQNIFVEKSGVAT